MISVKKTDPVVVKETLYVALVTLILSVLMQAVFLVIGKWDYTVLLGNILGALASVGNFFIMGISVQKALDKEEKDAKNTMKLSQTLRMFVLFAVAAVGCLVPVFSTIAVVIPFLFPRIAVAFRAAFIRKRGDNA